jgi:hypothetical protein
LLRTTLAMSAPPKIPLCHGHAMGATLGGFADRLTRSKAICGWCRRGDLNPHARNRALAPQASRVTLVTCGGAAVDRTVLAFCGEF